jgi:hypothetical protein
MQQSFRCVTDSDILMLNTKEWKLLLEYWRCEAMITFSRVVGLDVTVN